MPRQMRLSSMADNPERRPHGDPIPGTSGLSSPWRLPPATRLPAPSHLPPPSLATSPQTHGLRLWSRSGPPAAVVGRDIPPPTVRVLSEQSRLPPSALAAVASGPPSPWYESYSGGARSCFAPESVHHADPGGGGDARCDGGAPLTHIRAAPAALPRADDTRRSPLFFSKHLAYRSFVCAIAICLLWMTSLSATRYLVQAALVSPPFLLVASECRRTYSEVLRQKSDYVRCTSVQLKQCDEALAKSVSAEEARAASATEANSGTLGEARVTRIRCSAARAQALAALRALQRRGGLLRWDERACSAGEVHSVQALVGDTSRDREEAMGLALAFTERARTLHLGLAQRARNRARYDRDYLLNSTEAVRSAAEAAREASSSRVRALGARLAALNASLSLCTGATDCAARVPLLGSVTELRTALDRLTSFALEQRAQMASYQAAAEEMQAYMLQYKAVADAHIAALDPSFRLRSVSLPPLSLGELRVPTLPSFRQYRADFAAWLAQASMAPREQLSELSLESEAWASSLDLQLRDLPPLLDSYRPPALNVSEGVSEMGASASSFLSKQARAVDRIGAEWVGAPGAGRANGSDAGRMTAMFLNWSNPAPSSRASGFGFQPLKGAADESFQFVQVSLAGVLSVATAADLLWRGIMSVRLVLRYWLRASSSLPPLDLRASTLHGNVLSHGAAGLWSATARLASKLSPSRLFLSIALSPITAILLAALLAYVVISAAAGVYLLALFSYVDGCVTPPRNGTLLCSNIYAVAYDHAAAEGEAERMRGLDAMHALRASNCSARLRSSATVQAAAAREMEGERYLHLNARTELSLLRRCLDVNSTATAAETALGPGWVDIEGEGGTPDEAVLAVTLPLPAAPVADGTWQAAPLGSLDEFGPASSAKWKGGDASVQAGRRLDGNIPGQSIDFSAPVDEAPEAVLWALLGGAVSVCAAPLKSILEDGVFDCTALPECKLSCTGPSKPVLTAFSTRCGCHVEWLAHGLALQVLLSLLVYLCLQLCRILLVEATVRLTWHSLRSDEAESQILATVDEARAADVASFPACLSFDGQTLRERLETKAQRLRAAGMGYLLGAAAALIPAVGALGYVKANVAYATSGKMD